MTVEGLEKDDQHPIKKRLMPWFTVQLLHPD
jgi:hypothetical protein